MIPSKVKKYIDEYIYQEIYVQIALIKGKEKGTINSAINKYFNSNHFKELVEGKPYNHFIEELRDKCLSKLINSPMRYKDSNDKVIKELQKKLNEMSKKELENTYWEIETGEYLNNKQVNELEIERDKMIKKLNHKKKDKIYETIINYCKKYEELCNTKYPEAPLPLEILKSLN
jgi:hypothetical protein